MKVVNILLSKVVIHMYIILLRSFPFGLDIIDDDIFYEEERIFDHQFVLASAFMCAAKRGHEHIINVLLKGKQVLP